jgi:hypothetical protein
MRPDAAHYADALRQVRATLRARVETPQQSGIRREEGE